MFIAGKKFHYWNFHSTTHTYDNVVVKGISTDIIKHCNLFSVSLQNQYWGKAEDGNFFYFELLCIEIKPLLPSNIS
jgi:hypothetical protein